jgi:CheY-like chemotaxis protein
MARILIIDDDLFVSRLLTEHLTNEGHKVSTSHMAEEGFKAAIKSPPDLILLDVNLPDATGFQICGRFREHKVTKEIPIVMMTGAARSSSQQSIGRQMGADDYILKPFDVLEVGERIENLLPANKKSAVSAKNEAPRLLEPPKISMPETYQNGNGNGNGHAHGNIAEPSLQLESMSEMLSRISREGPKISKTLIEKEVGNLPMVTLTPLLVEMKKMELAPPVPEPESVATPIELPVEITKPALEQQPTAPTEIVAALPIVAEAPPATEAPVLEAPLRQEPAPLDIPTALPEILAEIPLEETADSTSSQINKPLWMCGLLFGIQVGLALTSAFVTSDSVAGAVQNASFVMGGWALLLGWLAATLTGLKITWTPEAALEILGWAAIPIVLRSAGALLFHNTFDPSKLPSSEFWIRPLDIFELASVGVLGFCIKRKLGATSKKSAIAAALIALAWCLTRRGYFRPF